jgi:hypothetical protein
MQYMLLIYENEAAMEGREPAQDAAMLNGYHAFTSGLISSGKFKASDRLQPTSTATTVRVEGTKTLVTDGPFAETREQLGGYYLIDATDLDDAIAIAARIPSASTGRIEVRPVWVMANP